MELKEFMELVKQTAGYKNIKFMYVPKETKGDRLSGIFTLEKTKPMEKQKTVKRCLVCGKEIPGNRGWQKFCSSHCRNSYIYRHSRGQESSFSPKYVPPHCKAKGETSCFTCSQDPENCHG